MDNINLKFSIIIPVYNIDKNYLSKCIDSIEQQDFHNYEIIIVNDGSNCETSNQLSLFANKYSNINLIEQQNKGVSAARNTGLKKAEGEWILFVDPDDWMEDNALSTLNKELDQDNDMAIFSYSDIKNGDKKQKNIKDLKDISKTDLQLGLLDYRCRKIESFFGAVWNCAYKRELLINNNILFDKELVKAEDTVFNLWAVESANNIKIVTECLYCYRFNEASLCHKFNPKANEFMPNAILKIKEFIDSVDKWSIFEKSYIFKVMSSYNEILKLYYLNPNNNINNEKKEWKLLLNNTAFAILKKRKIHIFKLLKNCRVYQMYLLAIYIRSFKLTRFAHKYENS